MESLGGLIQLSSIRLIRDSFPFALFLIGD